MNQGDWKRLLDTVSEIHELFPEGVAFIGGIAVYAHMMDTEGGARLAAMSHDGDLMIRLVDFSDLRDLEMLTPNRRLGKQQFVKNGFEFDVYVENQHDLVVPAEEVIAWSEIKNGIRVACLEHLLILKMKAYEDRAGSPKGAKDEEDIARILFAGLEWRKECLNRMTDETLSTCERIVAGDAPVRLMGGNLHHAKALRGRIRTSLDALKTAFSHNCSGPK
ncbi:hypothetical protein GPL21_07025 [Bradyrhizobium pachyrhizi]|uniref:Nucleotidyltransferase n=1 Tax=Bradyrhizobium pachyrhizi TaxID=280333 RepID=A0A844SCU5_9BRAD|nr:hypothetical protein [Bradyrhizobium pachyrhizi]MVT64858.1 hypothetical protein [Bradyrhizobium pachyrhizi]